MLFYDEDKEISNDDVFCKEHYQLPTYRIVDAIEAHKTTHQPMMLDALHMPLKMSIEMDMNGEKVVKKVSDFRRLVKLNHTFEHGQERSILFFGKDQVRSFFLSEKFSDYCRRHFFNARRIFPLATDYSTEIAVLNKFPFLQSCHSNTATKPERLALQRSAAANLFEPLSKETSSSATTNTLWRTRTS